MSSVLAFFSRCTFSTLAVPPRALLVCTALLALTAASAHAGVTLLVPSYPSVEIPVKVEKNEPLGKENKKNGEQNNAGTTQGQAQTPDLTPAQGQSQSLPASKASDQTDKARPTTGPNASPAANQAASPAPIADAAPNVPLVPEISEEVDVLITMLRPFKYEGLNMDMPQLFAVLRFDDATPLKDNVLQPERRDLLGDIEEIRYLDQKAWGANVELTKPGLHQFIIEARPWWDATRDRFVRHYVKTSLPVYGIERGWEVPVGQHIEIIPLTRPFGLTAPALFSGRAIFDGAPLINAPVRMTRVNTDKRPAASPWHEELAARTDANGYFSFVLNQPGWWACMAMTEGAPLRGPDGGNKPLELRGVFWLYVDAPAAEARKR